MLTRRSLVRMGGAAALLFGCLSGLFGCAPGGSGEAMEADRIQAVRLTSGGGMTGGFSSTELARQADGTISLVTSEKTWHNERARYVTYAVEADAFDKIAAIANDYDLRGASKRRRSDLVVLDADTTTLRFELMDEQGSYDVDGSFSISSEQELSDREREGWRAVARALSEMAGSHEGVESLEPLRFTLVVRGAQYQLIASECLAVEDLATRTPLDIELTDTAEGNKAFRLDEPLDVSDAPQARAVAGTLCYDSAEGIVVFFCSDGTPTDHLFELGKVESDFETAFIAETEPGSYTLWSNSQ